MGVFLSDANGLVGYRFIIVLVSPWAVFDAVAPGVVIANFIIICTFCVQRLYQVDPANGQSVVHPAQYSARLPTQLLTLSNLVLVSIVLHRGWLGPSAYTIIPLGVDMPFSAFFLAVGS